MRVAVVLFTRDLRVNDQPALAAAAVAAERVVPLFVLDPAILERSGANRVGFLASTLRDLRSALRGLGGTLAIRRGDVVEETIRVVDEVGASAVFLSEDASATAQARERRLRRACAPRRVDVRALPGVTVIPPGDLAPANGDHYRLFTAYWRRWQAAPLRSRVATPQRIHTPAALRAGRLPSLDEPARGRRSPEVPGGGEREGRRLLERWITGGVRRYGLDDDLAADTTSRLGPYLHFGCVSPLEVVERASAVEGVEAFVRQLALRDFWAQLLTANPDLPRRDLRPRAHRHRADAEALAAWKEGRTGFPLVDAGMRQLLREGWMHNRARLVTASVLTRHLRLDWRLGAEHFSELLVDGDVASNVGNWQWVAGTGVDTRPNRIFNPTRQARRFDPSGAYVRRYVPELAHVEGAAVHEPWRLGALRPGDYPAPIVDHAEVVARYRRRAASGPAEG